MLKKPSSPVRGSGFFLTRNREKDRNLKNSRSQKRGEKKILARWTIFHRQIFPSNKNVETSTKRERSPFLQLKRKNFKNKKNHQFHSYESDLKTKTGEQGQQQTFNNLVRSFALLPNCNAQQRTWEPEGTMSSKVRWWLGFGAVGLI